MRAFLLQLLWSIALLGVVSGSAAAGSAAGREAGNTAKASGGDTYIIRLASQPVAAYAGGIPGLEATTTKRDARGRFDARSAAARAYEAHLRGEQDAFLKRLVRVLGRAPQVQFAYRHALNGVAVSLSPAEARRVAQMEGVEAVERNRMERLTSDAGPAFIGAASVWGGGVDALGYAVELSGDNEVPPVSTTASGAGSFTYDLSTRELQYSVALSDITPTAAHIHDGVAGVNGPVLHSLSIVGSTLQGTVVLTPEQQPKLANQGLYVNVHSAANPGGQIRGQIRLAGTMGEGVVVGVLDTGINAGHPSFAAVAGDGYQHVNPLGAGNYLGHCVADPAFCNDKLIGAWSFLSGDADPTDFDSHGSHTAGTAVGNLVADASIGTLSPPLAFSHVSGVAPRANLVAYKVCGGSGCPSAATTAAVNQAIIDGVDVINYSISGGTNPYADSTAIAFRNAANAGIVVAASAGNEGPGAGTVNHHAPWVLTVAASTHNREVLNTLTALGSSNGPLADIRGQSPTAAFGPAPIVYAGAAPFNNPLCGSFPPGTFSGQIVVCDRGVFGRVQKGQNVLAAGAGGMVLANDAPSAASLNVDAHVLPAVHISHADGVALKAWLAAGSNHTGSLSGSSLSYAGLGDAMASFSSRGPAGRVVPELANLLKPDVSGPGLNIVAAIAAGIGPPPEFGFLSGTSMSSPHLAGAAALWKALHPDWSAAAIKSALMSTSVGGLRKEDDITPADPFDVGAGGVSLGAAGGIGFVLDVDAADYLAANPAVGGDPRVLNLPSLADARCVVGCSWTRTVRSVAGETRSYSVSAVEPPGSSITINPPAFSLAPGASQTLEISADVSGLAPDAWGFAQVVIQRDGGGSSQTLPLAVRPASSSLPGRVRIEASGSSGSWPLSGVRSLPASELASSVSGLVQGTPTEQSVAQDPTGNDAFNGDGGTFFITLEVPVGALRLVAEIVASDALDADLYVGQGSTPSEGAIECTSATSNALEYCDIEDPAAGTWWVLVQNWEGSGAPADAIRLVTAAVGGGAAGNLTVAGPVSVAGGVPYDLSLDWDDAAILPGTHWYGQFTLGSSPATPDDLARVAVDLVRGSEIVFSDGFETQP